MTEIKFGTDGWRAIIAKDYTIDNLKRVSEATAKWMLERNKKRAVIGYDCRFGGPLFAETTAQVLGAHGIHVFLSDGFASTPMVSLGVRKLNADLGIVITASHNPPDYNGFKLKSDLGGPMIPAEIAEVEALIPENPMGQLPELDELQKKDLLEYANLEDIYLQHVEEHFDLDAIRNSGIKLAYDAMYGAG
ncbi:MAG: phosphoglucomutase/phosphomannomutase family protein, partial [Saprospiraceae bacterium]|nr:phosphoglucomutase/phosphomannomutase family protein [Saprospiraceae bacterium]